MQLCGLLCLFSLILRWLHAALRLGLRGADKFYECSLKLYAWACVLSLLAKELYASLLLAPVFVDLRSLCAALWLGPVCFRKFGNGPCNSTDESRV